MVDLKTCSKCGESKPHAEFNRSKRHKHGLHAYCKGCHRAAAAAWYEANADRAKANNATWVKANPDKVRANHARWRKANPAQCRARDAKRTAKITVRARRYSRAIKYFAGRPRWVSLITACLHRERRLSQMEWVVPSLADHLSTQEIN